MEQVLSPDAMLSRMIAVEAAWTRTIAPAEVADRIAGQITAAKITPADLAEGTTRDGVPVPALVALLKAAMPEADHPYLHRGLTSQDVVDTAMVLALRDCGGIIADRLEELLAALGALSDREGAKTLMGMTRMQPALPMRAAERIASWQRPLKARADELPDLIRRSAMIQWGGPVGVRDPDLPADTGTRFANALGLQDPGAAWHSDRDLPVRFANSLSGLTGALGKMGQDIALMAQTGPEAITLSGGGGSSAMPHKQNPVLAEVLVTLARKNAADVAAMHGALVHEQERSGAAWMLEWLVLPQMLVATGASLRAAQALVGKIVSVGT